MCEVWAYYFKSKALWMYSAMTSSSKCSNCGSEESETYIDWLRDTEEEVKIRQCKKCFQCDIVGFA